MRPPLLHPWIYQCPLLATIASKLFADAAFLSYPPNEKGHMFHANGGTRCLSTCDNEGFCIEWTPRAGWSFEAVRSCKIDGATATVELPINFQTNVPPSARHLLDALRDTVLEAVRGKWEDVADRPRPDLWETQDIGLDRFPVTLTGVRFYKSPDVDYVAVVFLDGSGDFYSPEDLASSASVDRLLEHLEQERYEAETEYPFDVRLEDLAHRTPVGLGGTL